MQLKAPEAVKKRYEDYTNILLKYYLKDDQI